MTYTAADFDRDRLADYTLLIDVGQQEHAVAIVDQERRLQFLATYEPAAIDQQINDILGLDFGQVKIATGVNGYVFIPADVFDETQLPVYRRYFPDEQLAEPVVADIEPFGIKLVCQLNRIGAADFTMRFPHATTHPSIAVLLRSLSPYGLAKRGHTVLIYKAGPLVGIYVFHSGKLCYSNDFEMHEADDLNYYLLQVLDHLGLEGMLPEVRLVGDVETGDAYYQRIAKYSERIVFMDTHRLTGIAIPDELGLYQHRFLTIFGLNQCG